MFNANLSVDRKELLQLLDEMRFDIRHVEKKWKRWKFWEFGQLTRY